MPFTPTRAEMRFGYGLSPVIAPPVSIRSMLDGVAAPDDMAARFPVPTYTAFTTWLMQARAISQSLRQAEGVARATLMTRRRELRRQLRVSGGGWSANALLRRIHTPHAFRERLVAFWADHFTVRGRSAFRRNGVLPYIEESIRPNIARPFSELLQAVVLHPAMLLDLDQARSMGEGSRAATRRAGPAGLNENLARELLELHTLGVDGPYDQTDVRQLAKLLTGLSVGPEETFAFRRNFVEPGAETVLGKQYLGRGLRPIRQVLEDLAVHPATARHLAHKLAVHFVSDEPDAALVDHIADRWRETGGDLMAAYAALLEHPLAWQGPARNAKPPVDFVTSSCRALAIAPAAVTDLSLTQFRAAMLTPLTLMGQQWLAPTGPDGWPEEDGAWITPQSLAGRLRWALSVPEKLARPLPDPREFVRTALGESAPDAVVFAAHAAESRAEAIGLILSSPAFQRR